MASNADPLLEAIHNKRTPLVVRHASCKCPSAAAGLGLFLLLGLPPALWSFGHRAQQTSINLASTRSLSEKIKIEVYGMAG